MSETNLCTRLPFYFVLGIRLLNYLETYLLANWISILVTIDLYAMTLIVCLIKTVNPNKMHGRGRLWMHSYLRDVEIGRVRLGLGSIERYVGSQSAANERWR